MGAEDIVYQSLPVTAETIPAYILTAILFLVVSLYGFKLLKIEVMISGALFGYSLGSVDLRALIGDKIAWQGIGVLLGIITALLAVLLAFKVYKFFIFVMSALIGYLVGEILFAGVISGMVSLPAGSDIITTVLSIVFGIVVAYIVFKFFKPIFIVCSSLGGMALFFATVVMIIVPENYLAIGIATMIGAVCGIPAMIKQFRSCSGIEF